jgi:hypothetical protein
MGEYQPIPVSEAKRIAEQFDKDMVIINAWDSEHQLNHTTTYGKTPEQKEIAADAGEVTARALGCCIEAKKSYEDFRERTPAEAALEIERLRDELKVLSCDMIIGIKLIIQERKRQIEVEGWTFEHDDKHDRGELAMAAACYAIKELYLQPGNPEDELGVFSQDGVDGWPWKSEWDKRNKHSTIRRLSIAGALIAAEIDRLFRAGDA